MNDSNEKNATGVELTIPMPGHAIAEGSLERVRAEAQRLDDLVRSHDAVFLLLDSREARWLPSLLCNAHRKVIQLFSPFDRFLLLRLTACRFGAGGIGDAGGVKICINAALGFDSFMVMRHGASVLDKTPPGGTERLACYFCSDGSAPQDVSITD